ncbi:unnamed protein product [Urochloa decumbens]|uniref:Uncharacterized protein n=1 Tax=Urochloa decumbens TaxID=240449 RepID=A0ABC8ZA28_9POAL
MAEKIIKMRRQLAAPLMPAAPVAKQQQQARAFPLLPAVELVSLWGLTNVAAVALTMAVASVLLIIDPCVPLWMLPSLEHLDLTPDAAKDARARAILLGALLCTVVQAAAAALALLLPAHRRRIRRALAYAVLVAAVTTHCMYTSVVLDIHRKEYAVFVRITCSVCIFVIAACDLLCFHALLVGSDE